MSLLTPAKDGPGSSRKSGSFRASMLPGAGSQESRPPDGSTKFVLEGEGLSLCQPKTPTHFTVKSSTGSRLKTSDLKATIKGNASVKVDIKAQKDGALTCHYTCPMTGEYRLTLYYGTQSISSKPLLILCERPRPSERLSQVVPLQDHAFVDEVVKYRVTTFDQFGSRFTTKSEIKAVVRDGDNPLFEAGVHDEGEGVYSVGFTPSVAGSYILDVCIDGRKFQPIGLKVKADETIPGNCKLYGAELSQGIVGEPCKFMIQAVDGKHNVRTCGGDKFLVTVSGPDGKDTQADVKDRGDGTYQVEWMGTTAGLYLINVTLDGGLIEGCPVNCSMGAAAVDSSRCMAGGKGLKRARAGQAAVFHIQACDTYGNIRKQGGDQFEVVVQRAGSNAAAVRGQVDDLGGGNYRASYTANFTGEHLVSICVGGQQVPGSPCSVTVAPGDPQPGSSRLYGPGLTAVNLGRPTDLCIELVDEFGNRVSNASQLEGLELLVEGPSPVKVVQGPPRDGNLTYQYIAKAPGEYRISARVDNKHIENSPTVVVASVDAALPALCEVLGAPLQLRVEAGEQKEFSFVARDKRGTQKSLGGDTFVVSWAPADGSGSASAGKVKDLGTGEYSCYFSETRAGPFKVHVRLDGKDIAGSPFSAQVASAGACADATTCSGAALREAASGVACSFLVQPRDKFGNPAPHTVAFGPQGLQAALVGGENAAVDWLGPTADCTGLQGSYVAQKAGQYQLGVTYAGLHVKGSPFPLQVHAGPGCAQRSLLRDLPAQVRAGVPITLTVTVNDTFDNATCGGDRVAVAVHSEEASDTGAEAVAVTDHQDGTYTAQLLLQRAGIATVTAYVNQELLGEPTTIAVHASEPTLLSAAAAHIRCRAGQAACVPIVAKDKFGNVAGASDAAAIEARINAAPGGPPPPAVDVVAVGSGRFETSFTPQEAGSFQLSLQLRGLPASSIVLPGQCEAGPLSLQHCQVEGWDKQLRAGEPGEARLRLCDASGNLLTHADAEEELLVSVAGDAGLDVELPQYDGGAAVMRYSSRTTGCFSLSVSGAASQQPLAGAPLQVEVLPGPPSASNSRLELLAGLAASQTVEAGTLFAARLHLVDLHGNAVHNCPAAADLAVSAACMGETVQLQRRSAGGLEFAAALTRVGTWILRASIDGRPVSNTPPPVVVGAAPACPGTSRCSLHIGGHAPPAPGVEVAGLVQLHDRFGNLLPWGGSCIEAACQPPGGAAPLMAAVQDLQNGMYRLAFAPDRAGVWEVRPFLGGEPFALSAPVQVRVSEGAVRPEECVILWPDLKPGNPGGAAVCGSCSTVLVRTRSEQRCFSGEEVLTVVAALPGGSMLQLPVTLSPERGEFAASIAWCAAGKYEVSVKLGGVEVPGSPATFSAQPGSPHLPSCSLTSASSLAACVAGQPHSFSLLVRDQAGNPVPAAASALQAEVCCPSAGGSKGAAVALEDSGTGEVRGVLELAKAGSFELVLRAPGAAPDSASFAGVCLPGEPHCDGCALAPLPSSRTTAGEALMLQIATADRHGNALTVLTPEQLTSFSVHCNGSACPAVQLHAAPDGLVAAEVRFEIAGSYQLQPLLKGQPIAQPHTVSVAPAEPHPSSSCLQLAGGSCMEAGTPVVAKVLLMDRFRNPVPKRPEACAVAVTATRDGDSVAFSAAEGAAGEFEGRVTAAGMWCVSATVDACQVAESPVVLTVVPAAASVQHSTCSWCSEEPGKWAVARPVTGVLQLRDAYGNPLQAGGHEVAVRCLGSASAEVAADVQDLGNGQYTVSFVPEAVGKWELQPTVDGQRMAANRAGSVLVREGPAAPEDCIVSWPDLAESGGVVLCGSSGRVIVTPHGDRLLSAAHMPSITLATPGGVSLPLPIAMSPARTACHADVLWTAAGTYKVSVKLGGVEVPGSPATFTARAGPPHLPSCSLTSASSLAACVAGQPHTFALLVRDQAGNPVPGAAELLQADIPGASAGAVAAWCDANPGEISGTLKLSTAGPFRLVVKPKSTAEAPESCTFDGLCVHGEPAPAACRVEPLPSTVTAGRALTVCVAAADVHGNDLQTLTAAQTSLFSVSVDGPASPAVQLRSNGNGSVSADVCFEIAGAYQLQPMLKGQPIAQPHPVSVAPSKPHPSSSCLQLAGGCCAEAGASASVRVVLLDRFQNALHAAPPGCHVEVKACRNGQEVAFRPSDADDGVVFDGTVTAAGVWSVSATVDGLHVAGSPAALTVLPSAASAQHSLCSLSGDGTDAWTVAQPVTGVVQLMDKHGNPLRAGDNTVTANCRAAGAASEVAADVEDLGNAQYKLSFVPQAAGKWELSVKVDSVCLADGRPIEVVVQEGMMLAEDCHVLWPDFTATNGAPVCGSSSRIALRAREGRAFNSSLLPSLTCTTPAGHAMTLPLTLSPDLHMCTAAIPWHCAGDYQVSVRLGKLDVPGSPASFTALAGPPHLPSCGLTSASSLAACVAGQPHAFALLVRDQAGNPVPGAAALLQAETSGSGRAGSSGAATAVEMRDRNPGEVEGRLTLSAAGPFQLQVQLKNSQSAAAVSSRTFPGQCVPGDPHEVACRVDDAPAVATAGQPIAFRILTADQHGNALQALSAAQVALFGVAVEGPSTPRVRLRNAGDGSLAAEATVTAAGSYAMQPTLRGAPIAGGAVEVLVAPAPVHEGSCSAVLMCGEPPGTGAQLRAHPLSPSPTKPERRRHSEGAADSDRDSPVRTAKAAAAPAAPAPAPAAAAQGSGKRIAAGTAMAVEVVFKDRFGNYLSPGTDMLQALVSVTADGPDSIRFEPGPNPGSFCSSLTKAGSYTLSASVGGTSLPGWPRTIHVEAAHTHPELCRIHGAGPRPAAVCGEALRCHLLTFDGFGNARALGGDRVEIDVTPPAPSPATKPPMVTDNRNGSYTITFEPSCAGVWKLLPVVNGEPVPGQEVVLTARPPPLQPESCVAVLDSSKPHTSGGSSRLRVALRPELAALGVQLQGSEAMALTVAQPSGWRYRVPGPQLEPGGHALAWEVAWYLPGSHSLLLTLDGSPLPDMPLSVPVAPGLPCHSGSHLVAAAGGAARRGGNAAPLAITVVARDAMGNPTAGDASAIRVVAEPPDALQQVSVAPEQGGDSSRIAVHAAPVAPCTLQVMLNEQCLLPEAIPVSLSRSGSCILRARLPPSGLTVRAGEAAAFVVEACDSRGLPADLGGAQLVASIAPASSSPAASQRAVPVACSVEPLADAARFRVHFQVDVAAQYTASVMCEAAADAAEVPIAVEPGPACASQCRLQPSDGADRSPWRAGSRHTLRCQLHDRLGNALARSDNSLRLCASGAGPGPIACSVEDTGGGVLLVHSTARVAGEYQIALEAAGAAVAGAPVSLRLRPAAVSATGSWWSLEGADAAHGRVAAGRELTLRVALRDAFGNPVVPAEQSHCTVEAEVSGPAGASKLPLAAPAGGEGLAAAVQLKEAGEHRLKVRLLSAGGAAPQVLAARGSPSVCTVMAGGVSAEHCIVRELPAKLACGQPHMVIVIPCDAFGNPGASGGAFGGALVSARGPQPCRAAESMGPDRQLAVAVEPRVAGDSTLELWFDSGGRREVLAKHTLRVTEAGAAAKQTSLFGFWPPQGAVAAMPCGFAIQARDPWGNACSTGGLKFSVELAGLVPGALEVRDRSDGTYAVQYIAPTDGVYTLSVMMDGQHLKGSPMTLTVYADILGLANQEMQQRLTTTVTSLRKGVAEARQMHGSLQQQGEELRKFIPLLVEGAKNSLFGLMKQQAGQLNDARKAYQQEAVERRRLHNLVQELRGNIRVFCRVKPLPPDEAEAGVYSAVHCPDDHRVECVSGGSTKGFEYDRVFGPDSTQQDIFGEVQQLVTSALDGYNVCIFAYGQTGAGKTYTMEGPRDDPGISFRTMRELFRSMEEERSADCAFEISCSMVEIYNEAVRDLLSADIKTNPEHELELKRTDTGFEPVNVTEVEVRSPEQILDIMARGFDHRAQACHDINAHSSRSHALLIINVVGTNISNGVRTIGKLTLCDLAGSERINKTGATGLTLTEAQNINKSLLELGNVMSALLSQSPHVPYRNSKLTMLLQDSMGGDSKALMVCNVTPSVAHLQETLSSLGFASKVANVSLGTPRQKLEDMAAASRRR